MEKELEKEKLENKIVELEQTIRVLRNDLIHDSLTRLKTRAFLEEEGRTFYETSVESRETRRSEWFGFKKVSFILFDIDYFKKINDTYGHTAGDGVLKVVASNIEKEIRKGDIAARWGGEEFAVLLVGASESRAKAKAEDIRKSIERLSFNNIGDLKVTVSGGVSVATPENSFEEMIVCADKALYRAKESGRNKIVSWSEIEK